MDGVGVVVDRITKGQHEGNLCGHGVVLYLDCGSYNKSVFQNLKKETIVRSNHIKYQLECGVAGTSIHCW